MRKASLPSGREKSPLLAGGAWQDGRVLPIFLQDTTHYTGMDAGFLAICERVPEESWYLALSTTDSS